MYFLNAADEQRSGAQSSRLKGAKRISHGSAGGMVLDSPFADLQVLAEELVEFYINVTAARGQYSIE